MGDDKTKAVKPEGEQHINLKVSGQDGSIVQFKIKRHTPLKKLMQAYCERQGITLATMRFRFDGAAIAETDTPNKLDMEDDDTIDVFTQQTGGQYKKKKVIVGKPYRSEEELAEKFIDHKLIKVFGGKGGDGRSSFLREKYRPFGGPDGGNGGNGGDVIFTADSNIKSLEKLKSIYQAPDGGDGGGTNCYGRNGKSLYVQFPVGTYFCSEEGEMLNDLQNHGDTFVAAHGGLGGKGNRFFVTNTFTTPEECTPGEPGETKLVVAELRTLAHAGLVGFPNAGKSTLLRALSRAKPQVGDYQFTTLRPHVGILHYGDFTQIADIPGIIEGAHENFGLGLRFLRHVERCRFLIFLVDLSDSDPWRQIVVLRDELSKYEETLLKKPAIYVANKIDLPEASLKFQRLREQFTANFGSAGSLIAISGKRTTNLEDLIHHIRYLYDEDLNQHGEEDASIIW